MPDLQKPVRQIEQRLGEVSREILRIEAHIRRGEMRAATARLQHAREHLIALESDTETPMQMALVGAQLGLMSGGSAWLRGRLPAAIICGVGGWMYGQSLSTTQRHEVQQMAEHIGRLEVEIQRRESATSDTSATGS